MASRGPHGQQGSAWPTGIRMANRNSRVKVDGMLSTKGAAICQGNVGHWGGRSMQHRHVQSVVTALVLCSDSRNSLLPPLPLPS
eukprot:366175-Chlamydomonas_euryale.AAC.18